jgi:hypothetical protein
MLQSIARSSRRNTIVVFWLLVLPLFVDQANLLDLVSGIAVVHDDGELGNPVSPAPVAPHAFSRTAPPPIHGTIVLYDQDSPSPPPTPPTTDRTARLENSAVQLSPLNAGASPRSLYLLHRSFLL